MYDCSRVGAVAKRAGLEKRDPLQNRGGHSSEPMKEAKGPDWGPIGKPLDSNKSEQADGTNTPPQKSTQKKTTRLRAAPAHESSNPGGPPVV